MIERIKKFGNSFFVSYHYVNPRRAFCKTVRNGILCNRFRVFNYLPLRCDLFSFADDDDAADEYILRKRSVLPVDYGIFFNGKGTGTTTRRSNQMSAGTSGEAPVNNPDNRIFGAKSVNTSGTSYSKS